MTNKTLYLVCYDIVQDSRRNRVSKLLEAYGCRVQKSVFEILAAKSQYDKLKQKLEKMLNLDEDQLRFYIIPEHSRSKTLILGIQPDFYVDDTAFII
ncbi:CRISPR-associated endonuclease Cas2 [Gloeothece verrucosa]|uniref:CRISPR-associated endoribonuclease Cas2 n=1 Tax=Gloeothece verrucosa (strain PCC 7822) TaxID=497965 RepID=E0UM15_GLOV7|nr:CRISPR-associated endonuclease Cas2 [Gloeothece verrucosa]ADN17995.1 CRISPR-associated protein Cas2 [Gloeothece verrucosa PCC 7822]